MAYLPRLRQDVGAVLEGGGGPMNESALESVLEANFSSYRLFVDAFEKLKAIKGDDWDPYKKHRWDNFGPDYRPRIQKMGARNEESIWELQQRLSAAEREAARLEDATRPIGHYGDVRGTAEQREELGRLRFLIRDLNRRILNHGN